MKLTKLLAVAVLAPAVAFAAPKSKSSSSSPAPATAGSPVAGLEVGGFLGYEATSDFSGLALRLDGELPFRELSPQVKMSWVGSIGYSHLTWDIGSGYKATANLFKLVPAARFTLPLNEQFSVFGDAGLGLVHIGMTVDMPTVYYFGTPVGGGSVSASSNNFMMRLGAGAFYQLNPQLKLDAMLEFDPIFGDFGTSQGGVSSQNTWMLLVGMMYRI